MSTEEFKRKQRLLKDAMHGMYQVKANFTPVQVGHEGTNAGVCAESGAARAENPNPNPKP